jgi:hypothetical protein
MKVAIASPQTFYPLNFASLSLQFLESFRGHLIVPKAGLFILDRLQRGNFSFFFSLLLFEGLLDTSTLLAIT